MSIRHWINSIVAELQKGRKLENVSEGRISGGEGYLGKIRPNTNWVKKNYSK